jgi:Tol biopolymer transport system component
MLYSLCILTLLGATSSPSVGEIALLVGTEQEDLQVCLYSFADHTLTPIGPGERDSTPRWSPDGSQLAFSTKTPDGLGIAIFNRARSEIAYIPHQRNWCYAPRWSPEGNKLSYVTEYDNSLQCITVYDIQTKTEQRWAEQAREAMGIKGFLRPVWLCDLNTLNYLNVDEATWLPFSAEAEKYGIVLALAIVEQGKTLTTEPYALTPTHAFPLLPKLSTDSLRYFEWFVEASPTGQIVYESNDGGDREIYSLHQRDVENLSNHRAADWRPVWAHGGRYLLFESFRNESRGIYCLDTRTSRTASVAVEADHNQWSPAWSPDDHWLVFVADQSGYPELYVCDIEGNKRRQLTQEKRLILAPTWRPIPQEEN